MSGTPQSPAADTVIRPRLLTAQRPGTGGVSDDRIFTAGSAAIVLDGVTGSGAPGLLPGEYADLLGVALAAELADAADTDLRAVLADAIAATASQNGLEPGRSPQSTVAVARWGERLDVLVLGDTIVVVYGTDGGVEVIRDGRHELVVAQVRAGQQASRPADGISGVVELVRATSDAKAARRNRPGGYWIAEASPEAGRHAVVRSMPMETVSAVLIASDGVSCGPEQYAVPESWPAVLQIVLSDGPDKLLRQIHDAEAGDPDGTRWARAKAHDDKALAVAVFTPHWQPGSEAAW